MTDYENVYPHGTFQQGIAGLFGYCKNVTICNLDIQNASISTKNVLQYNQIYMGILAGYVQSDSNVFIENIQILNSKIECNEYMSDVAVSGYNPVCIGGIIGLANIESASTMQMNRLFCQVLVDYQSAYNDVNYAGGIMAGVSNHGLFECSNFASYLTAYMPTEIGENFAGAFGSLGNTLNSVIKLSDGFSEVKINHNTNWWHANHYYKANAIVGDTLEASQATFEFENLFGCVKPIDESAGFSDPICSLYELSSDAIITEKNCVGCSSLPATHGLDESIWMLDSISEPKLK